MRKQRWAGSLLWRLGASSNPLHVGAIATKKESLQCAEREWIITIVLPNQCLSNYLHVAENPLATIKAFLPSAYLNQGVFLCTFL